MEYIEHQVGELVVSQRQSDGYISATKLTRDYEKETGKYRSPNQWLKNKITNQILEVLSDKTKLPVDELVQKRIEGKNREIEIWIHPDLAIPFAMWLFPDSETRVFEWAKQGLFAGQAPAKQAPDDLAANISLISSTSIENKLSQYWDIINEASSKFPELKEILTKAMVDTIELIHKGVYVDNYYAITPLGWVAGNYEEVSSYCNQISLAILENQKEAENSSLNLEEIEDF